MFVEVSLSVAVFFIFALILWRLNNIKKPRKAYSPLTSKSLPNTSRKVSFSDSPSATEFTAKIAKEFNVDDVELPEEMTTLTLLSTDISNKNQQQEIDFICQDFRKPHPLLIPLTKKAFEPNELFDLIRTDPHITAKILHRVNSSAFALTQPITSINHAIVYLGIGTVKNIAMHFAIENNIEFESPQQHKAYQKLWNASYLASSLGLLFAKELQLEDASDISTRCLLNYLGDMAILSARPEIAVLYQQQQPLYQRVSYCQSQLLVNTQIIGSTLARDWQLPQSLIQSIEHNLSLLVPESKRVYKNEDIEIDEGERIKNYVCYIACRLADLVAINEQSCIETIRYDLAKQLDFYYLFKTQQHPKIKQLLNLFHDVSFSKKVNSLLLLK